MKAKIGIIVAVVALLAGIAVYKNAPKEQEAVKEDIQQEQQVPSESETQKPQESTEETEPVTEEAAANLSDAEKYEEALKNDLPTMLEFKTSG